VDWISEVYKYPSLKWQPFFLSISQDPSSTPWNQCVLMQISMNKMKKIIKGEKRESLLV